MKRILPILAVFALLLVSCKKEDKLPVAEFGQSFYSIYSHSSVQIDINLSKPASKAITIPVLTSGTADVGSDYGISASEVTIQPGETKGYLTIKDNNLTTEKSITLSLGMDDSYITGTKYMTVISLNDEESLVYSFKTSDAIVLESYTVSLSLTGTNSGSDFSATEDLTIPLVASGPGAEDIIAGPVIVKAGDKSGSASIQLKNLDFSGDKEAVLTVDPAAARYIPGDLPEIALRVQGLQTPDKLIGSWTFDSVYDLEELELWFMELKDDPDELPTHNEGFTLTFAKEGNDIVLTPGDTGDFTKFFRKSKVTLSTPVNMTSKGIKLGVHSTEESNMFISEVAEPYQQNTYYLLEKANLAFSADTEEIGSARIIFRITPAGDLCVEFREYNNADEFGMMWWDGGTMFDPDMFGFASLFKK